MSDYETKVVAPGSVDLSAAVSEEPYKLTPLDPQAEPVAIEIARACYANLRWLQDGAKSEIPIYQTPMGMWLVAYETGLDGTKVVGARLMVACRPGIPDNIDDYKLFRSLSRRVAEILASGQDTPLTKLSPPGTGQPPRFQVRIVGIPEPRTETITYSWPTPNTPRPQAQKGEGRYKLEGA